MELSDIIASRVTDPDIVAVELEAVRSLANRKAGGLIDVIPPAERHGVGTGACGATRSGSAGRSLGACRPSRSWRSGRSLRSGWTGGSLRPSSAHGAGGPL